LIGHFPKSKRWNRESTRSLFTIFKAKVAVTMGLYKNIDFKGYAFSIEEKTLAIGWTIIVFLEIHTLKTEIGGHELFGPTLIGHFVGMAAGQKRGAGERHIRAF